MFSKKNLLFFTFMFVFVNYSNSNIMYPEVGYLDSEISTMNTELYTHYSIPATLEFGGDFFNTVVTPGPCLNWLIGDGSSETGYQMRVRTDTYILGYLVGTSYHTMPCSPSLDDDF